MAFSATGAVKPSIHRVSLTVADQWTRVDLSNWATKVTTKSETNAHRVATATVNGDAGAVHANDGYDVQAAESAPEVTGFDDGVDSIFISAAVVPTVVVVYQEP